MRIFLIAVLVSLFTVAAHGQGSGEKYLLKVNGIGLGSYYAQVIRTFGKPLKETTGDGNECIGGKMRKLEYPGMTFELHQEFGKTKRFYVGSFEVTSARWNVSGLKAGSTAAAVKRKFGKAAEEGRSWLYEIAETEGPGSVNIYFRNGKVVRFETSYIC